MIIQKKPLGLIFYLLKSPNCFSSISAIIALNNLWLKFAYDKLLAPVILLHKNSLWN